MFYSAVIGFLLLSVPVALQWQTPTWSQVAVGCIVGFFATIASLMQLFAYRNASRLAAGAVQLHPARLAGGLGFVVFGTVPGTAMLIGAAVIAASGIYTAWREAVRAGAGAAAR